MRFYHGACSTTKLKKIDKLTDVLDTGFGANIGSIFNTHWPYFLDNGAFTEDFDEDDWIKALDKVKDKDNEPDFVVLPDSFDNPTETVEMNREYVNECRKRGLSYYVVAQKPMVAWRPIKEALDLDADGVFVGGSWGWKQRKTEKIVELAHKNGLEVHIGMPKDYYWAYLTGADSMDSTNVARNDSFEKISQVEEDIKSQESLGSF